MNSKIIGIRFQEIGKIYHFDSSGFPEIENGDFVVVETSRGMQLGEVAQVLTDAESKEGGPWKPIIRIATPRDLVLRQVWESKETEAIEACRTKLKESKIKGVKIISAEYSLDGKRLLFLYSSEGEENVNLSELKRKMKSFYRKSKIDFRQIGPRDVAKIIGGMGACGIENRCCSKFLIEFSPISIRMAKAQGISLAPSEITGMCGRLRCCLVYEYQQYMEARKELPKEKKRVATPLGDGKVINVSPLVRTILVKLDEGGVKEFSVDDLNTEKPVQPKQNEPNKNQEKSRRSSRQNRGSSNRKRRK